jgi:hypothetical protein
MAAADAVTAGAWTALSTRSAVDRFDGEVVGVDFPTVAMRGAEWVDGELQLTTAPMNDGAIGQPTSWRVTGLADPSRWTVNGNAPGGVPVETRVDAGDLVVATVVGEHTYTVTSP